MLGLKLNHVSKRGQWRPLCVILIRHIDDTSFNASYFNPEKVNTQGTLIFVETQNCLCHGLVAMGFGV